MRNGFRSYFSLCLSASEKQGPPTSPHRIIQHELFGCRASKYGRGEQRDHMQWRIKGANLQKEVKVKSEGFPPAQQREPSTISSAGALLQETLQKMLVITRRWLRQHRHWQSVVMPYSLQRWPQKKVLRVSRARIAEHSAIRPRVRDCKLRPSRRKKRCKHSGLWPSIVRWIMLGIATSSARGTKEKCIKASSTEMSSAFKKRDCTASNTTGAEQFAWNEPGILCSIDDGVCEMPSRMQQIQDSLARSSRLLADGIVHAESTIEFDATFRKVCPLVSRC